MIESLTDPNEAAAVASVAAATFPLACPPHSTPDDIAAHIATQLSPAQFAEWISSDGYDVLVARHGTPGDAGDGTAEETAEIVGYALVVHGSPVDPDVQAVVPHDAISEVSKMYVLPDHHGVGLSHQLMEAALGAARRHGSTTAWLGVNDENERAVRYYRKMGFDVVGDKTFDMNGTIEHDYVMLRTL